MVTVTSLSSENLSSDFARRIVNTVNDLLSQNHRDEAKVSVALAPHKKIIDLAVKYMEETEEEAKDHPVLSFLTSEIEQEFILHPDEKEYLGEVIVSLEKSQEYADQKSTQVEDEILELISHGVLHLLGIHHD